MPVNSLSFFISWRFHRNSKKQPLAFFSSMIAYFSIIISIAAMIVSFSIIRGFEIEFDKILLSMSPHLIIQDHEGYSEYLIQKKLREIKDIKGISPYIRINAIIKNGIKSKISSLVGVVPSLEKEVSIIPQNTLEKKWNLLNSDNIILGYKLAKELGVNIGDKVSITFSTKEDGKIVEKIAYFEVLDIFKVHNNLDKYLTYINIEQIKKYTKSSTEGFSISLYNPFNIDKAYAQIMDALPNVYVESWVQSRQNLYQDIQSVRAILYLICFISLFLSGVTLLSTLVISVKFRVREIAILRTLGACRKLIAKIFTIYGIIYNIIGISLGTALGVLISQNIQSIGKWIEKMTGASLIVEEVVFINFLPSHISIEDIVVLLVISTSIGLVASIYPAIYASSIEPSKIL